MPSRLIHGLSTFGVAFSLVAGAPAVGQDRSPGPASPAPAPTTLHADPVQFAGLGLTIRLPEGVIVETTALGTPGEVITIYPPDSTWRVKIEGRASRDRTLAPNAVIDEIAAGLMATQGMARVDPRSGRRSAAGTGVKILDRQDALAIGPTAGARLYAEVPAADDTVVTHGYTALRSEPGRFLIATLHCLPPEFERAKAVYEACLLTATFPDPIEVGAERAAGLLAADNLLATLSYEDYVAALPGAPEWRRLYRPAPTGSSQDAQEVAYQRVEMREGKRGELNAGRPRSSWTAADEDDGLIVRVAARFVEGERLVDSESVYFARVGMAARDEEAWTVRMRIRQGTNDAVWTETGARLGDRLTVRVQPQGDQPIEKTWTVPERGYISQAQVHLLPRVLAGSGAPLVFAFYAYNSSSGKIELRREVLEPAPSEDAGWTLKTRIGEGSGERTATLTLDGGLVRLTTADGVVMEPIEVESLQRLWKSKNLPTGN